ncbi:uncharacterized protein LOC118746564 [Rhagoletis pomonella]|uniref:uncharacterized protein LOC118746564 n=1 Tax=Rhagoletis pomonella TaxID=28610 RepID=UPI0017838B3A|nr:uncharacterized protein LOC118746564 [Rhagoletis pomonella]
MAAVQRKLVHKQFNSPIGLYSQQNVNETLSRELKAFGADGIEVDPEISKPLNLANSAVLRAVEEEEQMKCDVACQRQSRPRQRRLHPPDSDYYQQYYEQALHTPVHQQQLEQIKTQYLYHQHDITVDRDTVLKINRLATRRNLHKRDHSWPPPSSDYAVQGAVVDVRSGYVAARRDGTQSLTHSRSSSKDQQTRSTSCSICNNNSVHFAESVCKRHGIDAIREKFNSPTRIIEPTPTELRQRNKMEQLQSQKQKVQKNATNKSARVADSSRETRANVCTIGTGATQQTLTNVHNNMANTSSVNAAAESFSDTKKTSWPAAMNKDVDGEALTNVANTNNDYDDVDDYNTPVARGFSAPETKAADVNVGLVEPRCYYFEQLARREGGAPKKWHSYDNIAAATAAQQQITATENTTKTGINNNRQSQSLDRGRTQQQRRREQLPPLKPRFGGGGSSGNSPAARITPANSVTEVNIMACNSQDSAAGSGRAAVTKPTAPTGNSSKSGGGISPRVQRRAIKLATEIKICYNDMDADEGPDAAASYRNDRGVMAAGDKRDLRAKAVAAAEKQNASRIYAMGEKNSAAESIKARQASDLEHIPLPPTPQAAKEATQAETPTTRCKIGDAGSARTFEVQGTQKQLHQKQQDQLKQEHRSSSENNMRQHAPHTARIIPIEVEQDNVTPDMTTPRRNLSTVSADQLYDDACIYLRSIDLEDRTVAYIPAAITIVPSPTEEMLKQWGAGDQPQNLKAGIVTRRELEKPIARSTDAMKQTTPTPPSPPVTQRSSSRTIASTPRQMAHKQAAEHSSLLKMPTAAATGFCSGNFATTNENLRQSTAGAASSAKNINNQRDDSANKMDTFAAVSNKAHQIECTTHATQTPTYNTAGLQSGAGHQSSHRTGLRNRQPQKPLRTAAKANENEVAKSKIHATVAQRSQQKTRLERPRGIYYTDGEYLYGPFGETPDECENPVTPRLEKATTTEPLKSGISASDKQRNCVDGNEWEMSSNALKGQQQQQQQKALDRQQRITMPTAVISKAPAPKPISELLAVSATAQQEENAVEIAALEAKYGLFQQSIAEHLRQIDAYMENAKLALNRSLPLQKHEAEQPGDKGQQAVQQPRAILQEIETQRKPSQPLDQQAATTALPPLESPLQTLARQLLPKQALHVLDAAADNTPVTATLIRPVVLENMPVVEQALQDLSDIKVDSVEPKSKVAKLAAKHVPLSSVRQVDTAVEGGSVLQPLMRRLIAVPTATPDALDAGNALQLLTVEHHFAPTATWPKRVTILENLDDVSVAAGRKPTNIVLIEIEEDDKLPNVTDEIAVVNDKIDDSDNCERATDNISRNDISELEDIETNAEVVKPNENGNFENIQCAASERSGKRTAGQGDSNIKSGDAIQTKIGDKAVAEGGKSVAAPEHVVDVVANYEQLAQVQHNMPTPAIAKTTAATSMKQQEQSDEQSQKQQPNQQVEPAKLLRESWAVGALRPKDKPAATTTQSAPTTPVPRRRTTAIAVEGKDSTTSKTTAQTAAMLADKGGDLQLEPESHRCLDESLQRQQQHVRLQQEQQLHRLKQSQQASQTPVLPTPPLRAGSLPKELCKNVVTGYISTHQSQEQLVEQVIDVLQQDATTEELEEKHKPAKQQQPHGEQAPGEREEAANNQLKIGVENKTSNQDCLRTDLVEEQQQAAGCVSQQLSQQQSASVPIMKSKRKLCSQQGAQSTESSVDTKSARSTVAAAAVAAAALAAQKVPKEETKLNKTTSDEKRNERVITGQRGKLKLHIQAQKDAGTNVPQQEDTFDTYKATYEIPSPIFKQQLAWQTLVDVPQKVLSERTALTSATSYTQEKQKRDNEVQIDAVSHTTKTKAAAVSENNQSHASPLQSFKQQSTTSRLSPAQSNGSERTRTSAQQPHRSGSRSRSSSPYPTRGSRSPTRKYPAALIEPHPPKHAASPFGLNPLDITELIDEAAESHAAADVDSGAAKRMQLEEAAAIGASTDASTNLAEFVPQLEGHNVGLLVRAPIIEQQQRIVVLPKQIEMGNALTHSAVTHFADAEASAEDDNDGGHDEQPIKNKTRTVTTATQKTTLSSTPAASSSPTSSSSAQNIRAMPVNKSHDVESETTAKQTQTHKTTHTQAHLIADSSVTDLASTATGKLRVPAQLHESCAQPAHQNGYQQQEVAPANSSQLQSRDVIGDPAAMLHHQCTTLPRESGIINRSFDNVSPRPYITIEGMCCWYYI